MTFELRPETEQELREVQSYHTKTYKKIDRVSRRILKGKAEYESTPRLTSWEQIIKLLIDEYWKSTERQDEQELINTLEQR